MTVADVNGWIYASTLVAICAALLAVTGGGFVIWRVLFYTPNENRPVFSYLIATMVVAAVGILIEQVRFLLIRLSRDMFLPPWVDAYLFNNTVLTVGAKLLVAAALTFAAVLKVATYRGDSRRAALCASTAMTLWMLLVWLLLGSYLESRL